MLFDERHFEYMNIVGRLVLATCRFDIPATIHTKQAVHTHHNWRIAFLFELHNFDAKIPTHVCVRMT